MIGLITINDYKNIGNRLQNYAMFKILGSYDKTYNIVRYYNCEKQGAQEIKKNDLKQYAQNILKFFLPGKLHYSSIRYFNFRKFNQNIVDSEILSRDTNYADLNKKYDYFVTGSDQVWNPTLAGNGMYINMLAFTTSDKKIAGCPSIAIKELSHEQELEFRQFLSDFRYLSCRETEGAKCIEKLTGNRCVTLIDPTLMITREEWDLVASKPKFGLPSRFLFVYFLGNITEDYERAINALASRESMKIVNISDKNSKYYTTGPAEFLYIIKHSEIVVTDSYHGMIFSLIYNKPVKVLTRIDHMQKMNSRFDSIVKLLEINENVFNNSLSDAIQSVTDCWSEKCLAYEKKKFLNYFDIIFHRQWSNS